MVNKVVPYKAIEEYLKDPTALYTLEVGADTKVEASVARFFDRRSYVFAIDETPIFGVYKTKDKFLVLDFKNRKVFDKKDSTLEKLIELIENPQGFLLPFNFILVKEGENYAEYWGYSPSPKWDAIRGEYFDNLVRKTMNSFDKLAPIEPLVDYIMQDALYLRTGYDEKERVLLSQLANDVNPKVKLIREGDTTYYITEIRVYGVVKKYFKFIFNKAIEVEDNIHFEKAEEGYPELPIKLMYSTFVKFYRDFYA